MLLLLIGRLRCDTWASRPDITKGMDSSFAAFQLSTNSSDFQTKLSAFRLQIDLRNPNLTVKTAISEGHLKTPQQFALEQENLVYAVINGGYFDMVKNLSVSYLCLSGQVRSINQWHLSSTQKPTVGAFGVDSKGQMAIQYTYVYQNDPKTYKFKVPNKLPGPQPTPQQGQVWDIKYGIGAGPTLIRDSQPVDFAKEGFNSADARNPRSAVCIKQDGKLMLIAIDGRSNISAGVYLRQQATMLKGLGCKQALNLDGGGSTLLWINGKIINKPSDASGPRPVTTVLLVVDKFKKKNQIIV